MCDEVNCHLHVACMKGAELGMERGGCGQWAWPEWRARSRLVWLEECGPL